ncbi:MAG: anti-sigma factor domain-containing protein [Flavobacterium sp.]
MTPQEYIDSGVLELYVYGLLNEQEVEEVNKMALQHPEIKKEIEQIESTMLALSGSISPNIPVENFEAIKKLIFSEKNQEEPQTVIPISKKKNYREYFAWAAVVLLLAGLGYLFNEMTQKDDLLNSLEDEKSKMVTTLDTLESNVLSKQRLIEILRDPNNQIVELTGQDAAPKSAAKIYWNSENNRVFVDAIGLPDPPEGMVYQVWALKLNPLTPMSIGLLNDFKTNDAKIFDVDNVYDAEAFGITLEPAGGSPTPTLEQLFTLGKV